VEIEVWALWEAAERIYEYAVQAGETAELALALRARRLASLPWEMEVAGRIPTGGPSKTPRAEGERQGERGEKEKQEEQEEQGFLQAGAAVAEALEARRVLGEAILRADALRRLVSRARDLAESLEGVLEMGGRGAGEVLARVEELQKALEGMGGEAEGLMGEAEEAAGRAEEEVRRVALRGAGATMEKEEAAAVRAGGGRLGVYACTFARLVAGMARLASATVRGLAGVAKALWGVAKMAAEGEKAVLGEVEKARGLKRWLAARRAQRRMEKLEKALDLMGEVAGQAATAIEGGLRRVMQTASIIKGAAMGTAHQIKSLTLADLSRAPVIHVTERGEVIRRCVLRGGSAAAYLWMVSFVMSPS